MNQEELQRMFQEKMNGGGQQQSCLSRNPTEKETDTFIDRCMKRDETLQTLGQALIWKLKQAPMCTQPEQEVLPQGINRIQARLQKGEV